MANGAFLTAMILRHIFKPIFMTKVKNAMSVFVPWRN
jgi:hypothetical protein